MSIETIGPDAVVLRGWIRSGQIISNAGAGAPLPSSAVGGWASTDAEQWVAAVREGVLSHAPFRHMQRRRPNGGGGGAGSGSTPQRKNTPAAAKLSVAMTNCGDWGWCSNASSGYGYSQFDPLAAADHGEAVVSSSSGKRWPPMPPLLQEQAVLAASAAGFPNYAPDCCLVNAYTLGSRLALHRDEDEEDTAEAPIVSVSLGLPCTFMFEDVSQQQSNRVDSDSPVAASNSTLRGTNGFGSPSTALSRLSLRSGDVVVWGGRSRLALHGVEPLMAAPKGSPAYALLGGLRWNLTFRMAKGFYRRGG